MTTFILNDWICPKLAADFHLQYNDLIKVAANDINMIVDSLNIPVHALKVPIAKDYIKYNSYPNYGEVVNAKL